MNRYRHVPGFLVESRMGRIGGLAEAEYCEMLLPAGGTSEEWKKPY